MARVALVTGGTRGIGAAISKALKAAGHKVAANYGGNDAAAEKFKSETEIPVYKWDVSSFDACAEGIKKVEAELGPVDILVNNAGIFEPKDFFEIGDEDWDRFFEINVMSGVRMSRAYLQGMLKRNWGRIIFISSESALNIPTEMIHYGMTKTAQLAISRGLAKLTRGTGVTVNAVLPGPTLSEGVETFVKDLARQNRQSEQEAASSFVKQHRPGSLLQRFAAVDEVANMVVYVASPQASATNGAALRVEGGIIDTIA